MVIARAEELSFDAEKDLENYLLIQLSLLLSAQGQDLLVIGNQVTTAFGRRMDLLAIDTKAALHIIELKLGGTTPEIVGQVTDYLHWVRHLTTDQIIRVAARPPLRVNLKVAFQERFGHPLTETSNETQVLTIIAASIDLRTQRSLLAIRHPGLSTWMFRYVVRSDGVNLLPCCCDGQDVEASHAETRPPSPQSGSTAPVSRRSTYRVHIDKSVRGFWQSHSHHFTSSIVLFRAIYEKYKHWVRAQAAEGLELPLRTEGQFSRQLVAIVAESGEWDRVLVPPGNGMDALELIGPSSTRPCPTADHKTVAYLKKPVYRATVV